LQAAGRRQGKGARPNRRLIVSVAVALALVSLFFLLQVFPHAHANGQDDPACGLCQMAHMGVAPVVAVALLRVVLQFIGEISTPRSHSLVDPFFAQSPSRAPPQLAL
jgi:hypothetical protein